MQARTKSQEDQRKGPPARGAGGLHKQNLQSTASKKQGSRYHNRMRVNFANILNQPGESRPAP